MAAYYTDDFNRLFELGVAFHEKFSADTPSLAYHVLAAVVGDDSVYGFIKDTQHKEFLESYNRIMEHGAWEELTLSSPNDHQRKIILHTAEEFATVLGHQGVDAFHLLYACCAAVISSRRGTLNPNIDSWIMYVHNDFQEMRRQALLGPQLRGLTMAFFLNSQSPNFGYETSTPKNNWEENQVEHKISQEDRVFLKKFGYLMNDAAPSLFLGREKELLQIRQILAQTRKNNPLLIGEAGVGKTAIVEGLAQLIEDDDEIYPPGRKPQIYSLDVGNLLAGTMYRGELEERTKKILQIAERNKGRMILFIDEIHMLLSGISSRTIAEQFKPALARGDITVIGATTINEYRQYIEKDPALTRRFDLVQVDEPNREQTLQMLPEIAMDMGFKHNVAYTSGATEAAYDLAKRYLPKLKMPDAAITLLDKAGARQSLISNGHRIPVSATHIAQVVSLQTGVPMTSLNKAEGQKILDLGDKLKEKVFQQEKAIDILSRAVQSSAAGLRADAKTRGAFLFSGPTGVGKTEAAKVLADGIQAKLIRIDMSEYRDAHAVSKLVGTTSGFVGYHEGGVLTNAVDKDPYSVILLDEVEKAHPDVYSLLLQVLDNGRLKDGQGRDVDFRNTYIIMTTNAGQTDKKKTGSIGFTGTAEDTESVKNAINTFFSPEFRNRLDAVVEFDKLGSEAILQIAEKKLLEKSETLFKSRGIRLEFTKAVTEQVAKNGYDSGMGARPLDRYIQTHVDGILTAPILNGTLRKGDAVRIDFREAVEGKGPEFVHEKLRVVSNDNEDEGFPAVLRSARPH